jgi:hypothetical protein
MKTHGGCSGPLVRGLGRRHRAETAFYLYLSVPSPLTGSQNTTLTELQIACRIIKTLGAEFAGRHGSAGPPRLSGAIFFSKK